MKPLHSTDRGDWLLERVGEWATVGGVAGTGFEAYARILHAPRAWHGDADEPVRWTWAEVARRNRRTMHPLVQWFSLTDDEQRLDFDDGWRVEQTEDGQLGAELLAVLASHLAGSTATPDDITAAIWEGWGGLHPESGAVVIMFSEDTPPEERESERARAEAAVREERRRAVSPEVRALLDAGPFFEWPGRSLLLFSTSLDELADPAWPERAGVAGVMPQMLWPTDHRWVVVSEIDWDSTIVAGPRALIDAVLASGAWESFEVDERSDLSWGGDTVNPRPRGRMEP